MTSPWNTVDQSAEKDALATVTHMMVGTKMLQDEPGVVYSLAAQQAAPADAQAVDQFMQSLDAEKQVNIARASIAAGGSGYISLTAQQKILLDQTGTAYNDVTFGSQGAAQLATRHMMDATGGKVTPKLNADGSLALDAHGQIQAQKTHHSSGGWLSGFGSFLGSIGSGLKDAGGAAIGGLTKGYNWVTGGIEKGVEDAGRSILGIGGGSDPNTQAAQDAVVQSKNTDAQDMRSQGYDPNSFWSTMAFQSSGKAHGSLQSLNDAYGQDKVNEALQYLNDPAKFRKAIEADPNNFVDTARGQTLLTPEAAAKIKYLGSDDFRKLALQVNAHQATLGNDVMNILGVDPVAHSTAYNYGAAATNIAASFAIDPTAMTLNAVKVAKLATVGIDTLGDAPQAASILASTSRLPWVKNVQRGWQQGIDLGQQFRDAKAVNDTAQMAAITARFRASVPALEPIWENFTGGDRVFSGFHGTETELVNGKVMPKAIFEPSDGIKSLADAADFIESKYGMTRLAGGRAATQASLMPGALSTFGYRKVKGAVSSWMTARSADRATKAYEGVLTRAEADPLLAKRLIDQRMLVRILPEADDAVAHDGTVLAGTLESDPTLLPSQNRSLALTPTGKGDIVANLRNTGDALGDSALGRFSPTGIAARSRLAAQRLSTLLARNTIININDAQSGERLYKMAMTYLNRGDANTFRALYAVGDGGQRKAIIGGLIDQLGHAAGLGKSEGGQKILDAAKAEQSYSSAGSEIELEGQRVALLPGQTRQQWVLPSFQALQQASAKVGLWEATFGRALTSTEADSLMGQWKMGALFKPSTMSRNWLEGWLRTALEGRVGDAVKARAFLTTPNKEMWDRGLGTDGLDAYLAARGDAEGLTKMLDGGGLSSEQRAGAQARVAAARRKMDNLTPAPIVQHLLATESGDTALASQIEKSSMLSGAHLGRSVVGTKIADWAPVALAGKAYRTMVGKFMDEEHLDALLTLGRDELHAALAGYRNQALDFDLGFKHAAVEATQIAKDGFGPAMIRGFVHRATEKGEQQSAAAGAGAHTVWSNQALDGTLGVDRYANALGRIINANPQTTKAVLDVLEGVDGASVDQVVKALEQEKGLTAFGSSYFEDPFNHPNIARRALNDAERTAGKRDWAQKVIDEHAYLLTGRNDQYTQEIADYIREHGVAPHGNWIADNLHGDNRPASAVAPEVMAMPNGGLRSVWQTFQDLEGGAYQWMVERPLQRTTTSPVFLANYAISRKGLNAQVDQMVEAGISREAAENLAKELSVKNAWVKSEQMIDDPGQKAQFDVIARNMFPFARATQAMIRRWGTGIWQNPAAARKMMLAYEGGVHSGAIYNNAYGEPTFTYPGSGAMGMLMQELNKVPGFDGVASFPVASDMTGQVLMSVPGADNPLRMGMGPMISIPLREVYKHLLPTSWQGEAQSLDEFVNGPVGAGQTFSQLVPTAARRFFNAFSTDDRNSALASSMKGAFANLAAAGLTPAPNASPAQLQEFRGRLQTQTRNQLFLRFAFGLFAPASPTTSTEATSKSGSDFAWSVDGVKQLSEQYRLILNETGGDVGRAGAIFTALHPDEVVYNPATDHFDKFQPTASAMETPESRPTAKGAYLPSTEGALKWMQLNGDFVKKYGTVAAYFLPSQSSGEPFSSAAYQAQLELGLRVRKTPAEFMNDVYVKGAEAGFYNSVARYDQMIAAAKNNEDSAQAAYWTQQKSAWEADYKQLNPMLGAKLSDFGPARATALGQLSDIRKMLEKKEVPDGLAPSLGLLVKTYDNYESFIRKHPGEDATSRAARSSAIDVFNGWAAHRLGGTPLVSLYNGVFRTLNSNLTALTTGGS